MRFSILPALLLVAACTTTPGPVAIEAPPTPKLPGMDHVMGHGADAVLGVLGTASLDRREGMARQLQFAGPCVLDLYFYPDSSGAPVARHADARTPDGRAMAADACFRLLVSGRQSG